jgi:uncharacterized protein YdhG (YjbR/CyaY superfamily)
MATGGCAVGGIVATETKTPKDIDEYIAGFPPEVRVILEKIRQTIRTAAPEAVETIKYKMPTYVLMGNLIYFAAFKRHVSIFPAPNGSEAFNQELAAYRGAKSTVRFPLDKPVPYELIGEIVRLRAIDNQAKLEAKSEGTGTTKAAK